MTMEPNLPATRDDAAVAEQPAAEPVRPRQNLGVALLPLALIAFVVLAFIAAAWTFLATAGA
jgi:hypothetical protein